MGSTLAGTVLIRETAGPDEFRTAPLWGLGQRLFFLHDGRTSDLMQAIEDHTSPGLDCVTDQTAEIFKSSGMLFTPFSLTFTCGFRGECGVINKSQLAINHVTKARYVEFSSFAIAWLPKNYRRLPVGGAV